MVDFSHIRRPSLVIPGSSTIAPVLPLHEARLIEQNQHRVSRLLEEGVELHELQEIDQTSPDTPSDSDSLSMPAKKAKKGTSSSLAALPNGSTTSLGKGGDMNGGGFHERRKHPSTLDIVDDDSADARDRLMGRDTFTLDETPADGEESSKGFFELPMQDRRNFLLLVLLYFLQGIPMGLATGSVPFLLKSHLSYSQIGVYSLASYPYSLKLLWSPIVDACWSAKVGRRKSWILPIQMLSGFGMLWLGASAQQMMERAGEDNGAGVWGFTGWWFALVFMCATQDIAVDGECSGDIHCNVVLTALPRMGFDLALSLQPLLRLYRPDGRTHSRPVPLLHRIPRIPVSRLCQQVLPINTSRRRSDDVELLPDILGMDVHPGHHWPRSAQEGKLHEREGRRLGCLQDHGRHSQTPQHPNFHRHSPYCKDRLPGE